MSQVSQTVVDPVTMTVTANYLVTVTREMGQAMQNTAYSPIFNEALDFSCAVFDEEGEMIGQGEFCPAQLGATTMALRWIIDEFGLDALEPGDVFLHNDPYSGMNHLPEHMVVKAVFCDGQRVGIVACIGHMAEVGGLAPGGFPGDAREVFHEGLRIPPVKIVKAGVEDSDLWRLVLANGRTPRVTAGDLRAMIGSLNVGERRLLELVRRHGISRFREIKDAIKDYSERRMRAAIGSIPNGSYVAHEYIIDNDGWLDEPARVRVELTVESDRIVADFTGSDPQRQGSCNLTLVATISAVYNAILHMTDPDIPSNAGQVSTDRGDRAARLDHERDVPGRHRGRELGGASAPRHAHLEGNGGRRARQGRSRWLGDRDAGDLWRRGSRDRRAVQQPDPRGAGLRRKARRGRLGCHHSPQLELRGDAGRGLREPLSRCSTTSSRSTRAQVAQDDSAEVSAAFGGSSCWRR